MHLYERKERSKSKGYISVIIFVIIIAILFFAVFRLTNISQTSDTELLYKAINRAVVNCYAIEGRYPESLEYLVEKYGVIINDDRYLVHYEVFASNVKPSVRIIIKGEQLNE